MQEPDQLSNAPGHPSRGEDESARKERALKEILAESGREHERMKSALLIVIRKGLLILVLFLFCGFLSNAELGNAVTVLIFVVGTVLILLWRSSPSRL